jgi:hypothetical protein
MRLDKYTSEQKRQLADRMNSSCRGATGKWRVRDLLPYALAACESTRIGALARGLVMASLRRAAARSIAVELPAASASLSLRQPWSGAFRIRRFSGAPPPRRASNLLTVLVPTRKLESRQSSPRALATPGIGGARASSWSDAALRDRVSFDPPEVVDRSTRSPQHRWKPFFNKQKKQETRQYPPYPEEGAK